MPPPDVQVFDWPWFNGGKAFTVAPADLLPSDNMWMLIQKSKARARYFEDFDKIPQELRAEELKERDDLADFDAIEAMLVRVLKRTDMKSIENFSPGQLADKIGLPEWKRLCRALTGKSDKKADDEQEKQEIPLATGVSK